MALGIFLLILGVQTLIVDRWLISTSGGQVNQTASRYYDGQSPFQSASYGNDPRGLRRDVPIPQANHRVFRTREWMPWSLLAAGAVVVLYSYSLREGEQ